ncbi:HAD-IIIA family hydrolase [Ferruginibacter yonginensis]|uniref:D,D-heptose 1,7-bisphosphate phosphatase n=1 Tax=Ferruginibacter yonginensis TaxID=1310416 RepID=A0ABV8QQZ5_9BACT
MLPHTCIILAGGLGTRLQHTVPVVPKCLAQVSAKPFLYWLVQYQIKQGVTHFIWALGYKSDSVQHYIQQQFPTLKHSFSIEQEPLGTGGAIKKALSFCETEHVFVTNGDTLFKVDYKNLYAQHLALQTQCTLALKPMKLVERYGTVNFNEQYIITAFNEKVIIANGFINGGVYIIYKNAFLNAVLPAQFSFENDYLKLQAPQHTLGAYVDNGYFIDIGVPADYFKAQVDFKQQFMIETLGIDEDWTLFIDRDGVINHEKLDDYIHTWDEFQFYDGIFDAFKIFASTFKYIIVVTNQKGIGKGVTKEEDVINIHQNMQAAIEAHGGRIDAIYYCKDIESNNRKPNPGMGLQAIEHFKDIDLQKAVMVGNTLSDMQFGRNLGIKTVFLTTTRPEVDTTDSRIDAVFNTLIDFAQQLR